MNDCTDGHRGQKSHEISDHVRDAHQSSGKVWRDVNVIRVEAGVVEPVEADGDAKKPENGLVLTAGEGEAREADRRYVKG